MPPLVAADTAATTLSSNMQSTKQNFFLTPCTEIRTRVAQFASRKSYHSWLDQGDPRLGKYDIRYLNFVGMNIISFFLFPIYFPSLGSNNTSYCDAYLQSFPRSYTSLHNYAFLKYIQILDLA